MSGYIENIWNSYDKTRTEEENRRNGAIITKEKLRHMEEGIRLGNRTIKVGIVRTVPKDQPATVTVDETDTDIRLNFDIPQGTISEEEMQQVVETVSETVIQSAPKLLYMMEGGEIPTFGLDDTVMVLESEGEVDPIDFQAANFSNMGFGTRIDDAHANNEHFALYDKSDGYVYQQKYVDGLVTGELDVTDDDNPEAGSVFYGDIDD